MTRLPVDTWLVTPRLDLPPYELNTVCPVTGETSGLENHHIFRASFSALGKEKNDALYWVQVQDGDKLVLRNRVALAPDAHRRITENRAWLEYNGTDLYYYEREPSGEAVGKKLDLSLRLMEGTEKVSKRRKRAATKEERKARVTYTIRAPKDEEMVLPEMEEALRGHLSAEFNWDEGVPAYFVWVAAAAKALQ